MLNVNLSLLSTHNTSAHPTARKRDFFLLKQKKNKTSRSAPLGFFTPHYKIVICNIRVYQAYNILPGVWCVCVLHIKPFFYSSTFSTPSVRTDSSPEIYSVVTSYDTEMMHRNALDNDFEAFLVLGTTGTTYINQQPKYSGRESTK